MSAFGRKSLRDATEGEDCLHRSQYTGLGDAKGLGSTLREDSMLVKATEWPMVVVGTKSYGKWRLNKFKQ